MYSIFIMHDIFIMYFCISRAYLVANLCGSIEISAMNGIQGGTLGVASGGINSASVILPASALTSSVALSLESMTQTDIVATGGAPNQKHFNALRFLKLTPHGTTFATPVTISIAVPKVITGHLLPLLFLKCEGFPVKRLAQNIPKSTAFSMTFCTRYWCVQKPASIY